MKKRIGKVNKNIEELDSLEKTPSELLDLFLQEKSNMKPGYSSMWQ